MAFFIYYFLVSVTLFPNVSPLNLMLSPSEHVRMLFFISLRKDLYEIAAVHVNELMFPRHTSVLSITLSNSQSLKPNDVPLKRSNTSLQPYEDLYVITIMYVNERTFPSHTSAVAITLDNNHSLKSNTLWRTFSNISLQPYEETYMKSRL